MHDAHSDDGTAGVDLFEYQARDMFEAHGVPVLAGCDWFAGSVLTRHDDLGDHEGFVLDIIEARDAGGTDEQLGFQDVKDVDAGHPA